MSIVREILPGQDMKYPICRHSSRISISPCRASRQLAWMEVPTYPGRTLTPMEKLLWISKSPQGLPPVRKLPSTLERTRTTVSSKSFPPQCTTRYGSRGSSRSVGARLKKRQRRRCCRDCSKFSKKRQCLGSLSVSRRVMMARRTWDRKSGTRNDTWISRPPVPSRWLVVEPLSIHHRDPVHRSRKCGIAELKEGLPVAASATFSQSLPTRP